MPDHSTGKFDAVIIEPRMTYGIDIGQDIGKLVEVQPGDIGQVSAAVIVLCAGEQQAHR